MLGVDVALQTAAFGGVGVRHVAATPTASPPLGRVEGLARIIHEALPLQRRSVDEAAQPTIAALQHELVTLEASLNAMLRRWRWSFAAVVALLVATAVLTFACLLRPGLQRLVTDEVDVTTLLRLLSADIRNQIPAINDFLEHGSVDSAAEIQRTFVINERLLRNILPQNISARLKRGEVPIADTHQSLTFLFTDFVGFTSISGTMTAVEIVDFLNEVFVEFDSVASMLQLDKIKTVGDAYFMAGGLNPAIVDHAVRVVEAGIQMFGVLREHNARHSDRTPLAMRLGVHTGPAVAGVIGSKKVAFDLWGSAVEVANAMESTGVPGRVHISDVTLAHLGDAFAVQPRGPLPDAGPASMPEQTYIVVGRLIPTPYMHVHRPRLRRTRVTAKSASRLQ
jgi:class 3 adenylate cyclase